MDKGQVGFKTCFSRLDVVWLYLLETNRQPRTLHLSPPRAAYLAPGSKPDSTCTEPQSQSHRSALPPRGPGRLPTSLAGDLIPSSWSLCSVWASTREGPDSPGGFCRKRTALGPRVSMKSAALSGGELGTPTSRSPAHEVRAQPQWHSGPHGALLRWFLSVAVSVPGLRARQTRARTLWGQECGLTKSHTGRESAPRAHALAF